MFSGQIKRTILVRASASRNAQHTRYARSFQSQSRLQARKDTQDKDSMKIEPNEYSKSGSDTEAAHTDAAFSRDKTRPESLENSSGTSDPSKSSSPLNASPANPDLGKPNNEKSDAGGSPSESSDASGSRARSSGGSSPKKSSPGPSN